MDWQSVLVFARFDDHLQGSAFESLISQWNNLESRIRGWRAVLFNHGRRWRNNDDPVLASGKTFGGVGQHEFSLETGHASAKNGILDAYLRRRGPNTHSRPSDRRRNVDGSGTSETMASPM
jgi:hypothetical protein